MSAANKFEDGVEQIGKGAHQFHAAGHALYQYLTNNAPSASLDAVKADLAGITEQNGYAAADAQNDYTETSGTGTLTCVDIVWTGTGAGFGPFRYSPLYNETQTSPADPLLLWWDYGSSISVLSGETFTVDYAASTATLT